MTRKDYIILARALHFCMPSCNTSQWDNTLDTISDALAINNHNFNATLFKYACRTGDINARKPKAA